MHRAMLKSLPHANGETDQIIALFVDIRGFTSFPGFTDSVQAAMYLRKLYVIMLKNYFKGAAFFKLTGDGMLIVFRHEEKELVKLATAVVTSAIKLVNDFPDLLANDRMIIFDVPKDLGIGIARGTATRLVSNSLTLDYSGRPLNLAARLMDLARPKGVILDGTFTKDVIGQSNYLRFAKNKVYIKGIAELTPVEILATKKWTSIRDEAKRPIGQYLWHKQRFTVTLAQLRQRGRRFFIDLAKPPAFTDQIEVWGRTNAVLAGGRKSRTLQRSQKMKCSYQDDAGVDRVRVDCLNLANELSADGVQDSWQVVVEIRYRCLP